MIKPIFDFILSLFAAAVLSACGTPSTDTIQQPQTSQTDSQSQESSANTSQTEDGALSDLKGSETTDTLTIQIGDTTLTAILEDNASVDALKELLADGEITIDMDNYGGFEKVGALPESLPENDIQTTAVPGDIMLYQGNSIVIFYGTNTWAYTKIGTITGYSEDELRDILSGNEETLSLSLDHTESDS